MPTAAKQVQSQPATSIRLRPATSDDWPMIRAWLRLPAIEAWWGPASICEGEVIAALQADAAMARIIEVDGRPVGYAHAIDASLWGDELPHGLPVGTWDLDLFVADPELRGRGVGSEALSQLKSEVFATTLAVATCIFPSIANERAVRAFEKAGFAYKSVWQDPTHGPCWFMLCERNP